MQGIYTLTWGGGKKLYGVPPGSFIRVRTFAIRCRVMMCVVIIRPSTPVLMKMFVTLMKLSSYEENTSVTSVSFVLTLFNFYPTSQFFVCLFVLP